jgi:transposase-like protein
MRSVVKDGQRWFVVANVCAVLEHPNPRQVISRLDDDEKGVLNVDTRRGLRRANMVISDAHQGLKSVVTRVLGATLQRRRVHFLRAVLAHAGRQGQRLAAAFIGTAFAQEDAQAAKAQWRNGARSPTRCDRNRRKSPN